MTNPQELRDLAKAKAKRLAGGSGDNRVDSSSWSPPEKLKPSIKTGARPVSKQGYMGGGVVPGDPPDAKGGRRPRKDGGAAMTPDNYQNRDMKEANEKREGEKQVGGFKRGGTVMKNRGYGDGKGSDEKAILKGAKAKANGGGLQMAGTIKPDAPIKMDAPLPRTKPLQDQVTDQTLQRKCGGKVDMDDKDGGSTIVDEPPAKGQAKDAKASPQAIPKDDHDKDCRCKKCSGGRVERKAGGRTNINIIISPGKKGSDTDEAKPQMLPPMPPAPPIAAPPPAAMGMQRPPMPMPASGPLPGPGMPPPMMGRATGGKVYPIETGAGGGKARLAKKGAYGLTMNKDLNK